MAYYRKITGERVYLSPLSVDDAHKYTEWLNDLEISVNLRGAARILTQLQEREILERISREGTVFAIIDKTTERLIGNCGLHNLDQVNRCTEIGIFIGDKAYWNKGFGTEALFLLLDYCFNIQNLNSVMLIVKEFNKRAIRCYEKCGFKKIGVRRQAVIHGKRTWGELYMDLLASEFTGKLINTLFD